MNQSNQAAYSSATAQRLINRPAGSQWRFMNTKTDPLKNIDIGELIEAVNNALEAIDQLNLTQLNNQVDELYAFLNNIQIEDEEGDSVLDMLTTEIVGELFEYAAVRSLKWAYNTVKQLASSMRPEVAELVQGEMFAEQFVQNVDDIAAIRVDMGQLASQAQEAIQNSGEAMQQAQTAGEAASAAQNVTDDIVSSLLNTGVTAGGMAATAAGLSSAMSATGATFGGIAAAGAALGALGTIGSLGGGAAQGGEDYVGVEGLAQFISNFLTALDTQGFTSVANFVQTVKQNQTNISSLWSSQAAQDTSISELQSVQLSQSNQISSLQTQASDLQSNINSVGNALSQLTTQFQAVESAIQTAEQLRIELTAAGKTEYELVTAAFDNTGGGGGGGTGDVTQAEFDALSSRVTSIESFNNIAQVQLWDPSINSLETLYQRLRQSIPIPPENDHIGSHLISNDAGITNSTNFDFANTTGLQMDQLTFQVFVRFRDTMDSRVAVGSWASISAWGHSGGWDAGTSGSQGFYIIQHPTLANTFRLTTHLQFYHVFAGARFFWPVVDRIQIYIYHRNYSNRLTYWGGGQAGGGGGSIGEVTQAEFDALAVRVSSAEVQISQIKVVNNTQQNALDALASFTLPAITSKNTQQDNEISLLQNRALMIENAIFDGNRLDNIESLLTDTRTNLLADAFSRIYVLQSVTSAGIEIYQIANDASLRQFRVRTRINALAIRPTNMSPENTELQVVDWSQVDSIIVSVVFTRANQNLSNANPSSYPLYTQTHAIMSPTANTEYVLTLPGPPGSLDMINFDFVARVSASYLNNVLPGNGTLPFVKIY